MKVAELIELLQRQDPKWEVILHSEEGYPLFLEAYKIIPGVFSVTAYGNDFMPYEIKTVYPYEKMAVLIKPREGQVDHPTAKNDILNT